ncbi:NAD(P)-binding Rossmann-fold superfamily protein [Euphorbia peplus]|nr:NAD(P)-binding Rossmann-fold superfamily protein [Euphorbia peplus]
MGKESKRYAVVTGGDKGVGYAVYSDFVVFHQLDVADSSSIDTLAHFIKSRFGKLDILVNNEGVSGVQVDAARLVAHNPEDGGEVKWREINWSQVMTQTHHLAEECLEINYIMVQRG